MDPGSPLTQAEKHAYLLGKHSQKFIRGSNCIKQRVKHVNALDTYFGYIGGYAVFGNAQP